MHAHATSEHQSSSLYVAPDIPSAPNAPAASAELELSSQAKQQSADDGERESLAAAEEEAQVMIDETPPRLATAKTRLAQNIKGLSCCGDSLFEEFDRPVDGLKLHEVITAAESALRRTSCELTASLVATGVAGLICVAGIVLREATLGPAGDAAGEATAASAGIGAGVGVAAVVAMRRRKSRLSEIIKDAKTLCVLSTESDVRQIDRKSESIVDELSKRRSISPVDMQALVADDAT